MMHNMYRMLACIVHSLMQLRGAALLLRFRGLRTSMTTPNDENDELDLFSSASSGTRACSLIVLVYTGSFVLLQVKNCAICNA